MKNDITPIRNALDKVLDIHGVYYSWATNVKDFHAANNKKRHVGFVAQDVQKVLPEVVDDSSNYLSVDYISIIPLLAEAIKELKDQDQNLISVLREEIMKEIELLKTENANLRALLMKLLKEEHQ